MIGDGFSTSFRSPAEKEFAIRIEKHASSKYSLKRKQDDFTINCSRSILMKLENEFPTLCHIWSLCRHVLASAQDKEISNDYEVRKQ